MISLAGLSATYPGYQADQEQQAKTEKSRTDSLKNQNEAREAALKLLGGQVLGRALSGGGIEGLQAGPQAPPPGAPSMPAAPPSPPPMPQAASAPPPMSPQGGPQPAASVPPGTAPPKPVAAPEALPEISLQGLTQRILQTHPGIQQHPEVFMAAIERAAPLLDRQGKEDVAEMRNQFTLQRIQIAKERMEDARRMHDLVSQDRKDRETNVNNRRDANQEAIEDRFARKNPNAPAVGAPSPDTAPPMPTATDPKTGAKVQWDGKAWIPIPQT
jgi:hypothetical protein